MSNAPTQIHEQLAKVSSFSLGPEDHGIFTMFLQLDFGGSSQGFGGYSLDTYNKESEHREGTAAGLDFIMQVMKCLGINDINEMSGKMCLALKDKEGYFGKVIGIKQIPQDGHNQFLIGDWQQQWFPGEEDKF